MFDALAEVEALVSEAAAAPRVVRALLVAPEGVGRSFLLAQAQGALAARGHRMLRIDCGEGPAPALLVRALLGLGAESLSQVAEALPQAEQLQGLSGDSRELVVDLLSSLFGKRTARREAVALDAEDVRDGAFFELARWLELETQGGPLLLAFDDAHLAERSSTALFEFLVELERRIPLVVVLSLDANTDHATVPFRELHARWRSQPNWHRLPLPLMELAELQAVLNLNKAAPEHLNPVAHAARGNVGLALRLLKFVRAHPERLGRPLPGSLDSLRVEELRVLGPEALTCAHAAAVLGDPFPIAALSAMLGEGVRGLAALENSGAVRSAGIFAVPRYRFAERQTRHALLASLPEGPVTRWRLDAGMWAVNALETLTPENFEDAAETLLTSAVAVLDRADASLWHEAWAALVPSRALATEQLEAALTGATGVRRMVLARRVAEARLFLGKPADALAVLSGVARGQPTPSAMPAIAVGHILSSLPRRALDRWEALSGEEAAAAMDLVRAECLSHLVKKEETVRAFEELEKKLLRLEGPAASHLWVRWARAWSWFLCEILGRPKDALAACTLLRQKVPPDALLDDEQAVAFLRAEEMAVTTLGDFARSRVLVEELIALTERRGDLREQALAWNARAILQFGCGELRNAQFAFTRSLELARSTGWVRREAIALHNLALVHCELGELDIAHDLETRYAELSMMIGNHASAAEAPAVLAAIALARGEVLKAETLLGQARRVSETNTWSMLGGWSRALAGRAKLLRFVRDKDPLELTRARADLLAAIEVLEELSPAWTEEFDPGEIFALYVLCLSLAGQPQQVKEALARAERTIVAQNVVSARMLEVARAVADKRDVGPALEWFESREYRRVVELWKSLGAMNVRVA